MNFKISIENAIRQYSENTGYWRLPFVVIYMKLFNKIPKRLKQYIDKYAKI